MAKILLMVRGSGGDLFPFLQIGKALRERGHVVTVLTHAGYASLVQHWGLYFAPLDTPDEFEGMAEDQALLTRRPEDIVSFYRRHILPGLSAECALIAELGRSPDTVLIAHQTLQLSAQIAGEMLGWSPALVFSAPSFAGGVSVLAGLFGVLSADLNAIRAGLGLAPVTDWGAWLRSDEHSLGLWPDWFAAAEPSWPASLAPVGFILGKSADAALPEEVQALLAGAPAPVLITHGTTAPPGPEFFAAAAGACALLERPGVVVTRHRALIPTPLPSGVLWADYFPFAGVMSRFSAVVHHGGMGLLGQALAAGVPQLVLPFGFDRPDNALRLRQLGVGDFVPPAYWRPEPVARGLRSLLDNSSVRARCAEIARRMAAPKRPGVVATPGVSASPGDTSPGDTSPSVVATHSVSAACDWIERFAAAKNAAPHAAPGWGVSDSTRPSPARALSPEKRALLALRLKLGKGQEEE